MTAAPLTPAHNSSLMGRLTPPQVIATQGSTVCRERLFEKGKQIRPMRLEA